MSEEPYSMFDAVVPPEYRGKAATVLPAESRTNDATPPAVAGIDRFGFKADDHVLLCARWRTPHGKKCVTLYARRAAGGDGMQWHFSAAQSLGDAGAETVAEGEIYGGRCRVVRYLKGLREGMISRATRRGNR